MGIKLTNYGNGIFVFHCPGCNYDHPFHTESEHHPTKQSWNWNGSMTEPTITPSLLIFKDIPEKRCHSFITNGKIQFLNDCSHKLKGQTIEIPDWND